MPVPLEQDLQEGHVIHLVGNQMLHENYEVFQTVHTVFTHHSKEWE